MPFSIEDDQLDLEVFLRAALQEKLAYIDRNLQTLTASGAAPAELARWRTARDRFAEAKETDFSALTTGKAPAGTQTPQAARTPIPEKRYRWVPEGAVPKPRPYAETRGRSKDQGFRMPSAAKHAGPQPSPFAASSAPPVAPSGGGGMLSFLQTVQSGPAPPSQQEGAPPPVQTATPPPTPAVSASGPMLSFLRKMQGGESEPAPTAAGDAAAQSHDVLNRLKERAATSGFRDVYEMLKFKRERLSDAKKELQGKFDPSARKLLTLLDGEIAEIDRLMKEDQKKIASQLSEFNEVAAVDKGGVRELQKELSGLFDELK